MAIELIKASLEGREKFFLSQVTALRLEELPEIRSIINVNNSIFVFLGDLREYGDTGNIDNNYENELPKAYMVSLAGNQPNFYNELSPLQRAGSSCSFLELIIDTDRDLVFIDNNICGFGGYIKDGFYQSVLWQYNVNNTSFYAKDLSINIKLLSPVMSASSEEYIFSVIYDNLLGHCTGSIKIHKDMFDKVDIIENINFILFDKSVPTYLDLKGNSGIIIFNNIAFIFCGQSSIENITKSYFYISLSEQSVLNKTILPSSIKLPVISYPKFIQINNKVLILSGKEIYSLNFTDQLLYYFAIEEHTISPDFLFKSNNEAGFLDIFHGFIEIFNFVSFLTSGANSIQFNLEQHNLEIEKPSVFFETIIKNIDKNSKILLSNVTLKKV